MRIHTTANYTDVRNAAEKAGVAVVKCDLHGSRSRPRAFEIKLEGASRRRPNFGASDGYAATWDQWGVFLGFLFDLDPEMTCWAYKGSAEFHYATMGRFEDGWPSDAHGDHTFRYQGVSCVQSCTKCTASQTWAHKMAA